LPVLLYVCGVRLQPDRVKVRYRTNPVTRLHAFAMEIKEHVPWIASMLATAVAFVGVRYRSRLLNDAPLRHIAMTLLGICFALTSIVGLLGIFINKVAPL